MGKLEGSIYLSAMVGVGSVDYGQGFVVDSTDGDRADIICHYEVNFLSVLRYA